MSLIRNLATLLQNEGLGTVWNGTTGDIFVEEIPTTPNNLILLLQNISPEPSQYLNTRTLNFDVVVRNMSTKDGNDIEDAIFEVLHRNHHITLGDYYVQFIGAIGNVENQGKDIDNRSLHKVTYRAIYIDYRTVS